jgi:hypothetical protein
VEVDIDLHCNDISYLSATTAGNLFFTGKGSVDHGRSAPHPAVNRDGTNGAIHLASSAFHAGHGIGDARAVFNHSKDLMRANHDTHGAAITFLFVQNQRIFEI